MRERECWLSLGANLGNREKTLREALGRLHEEKGISLCRVSSFYQTAPWGKTDQPSFINAAAVIRTQLSPLQLLRICQRIEQDLGRVRHEHWGARTIDIDLLHMEDVSCDTEELSLPHPYMLERAFVLVPLSEIAGNRAVSGRCVQEHLENCGDSLSVRCSKGSPVDFRMKAIACVDRCGGIGKDGRLLFHIPEDMAFFRKRTMGAAVIMGRRTMETLEHPLLGRRNIVLSQNVREKEGFEICASLEDLWQKLLGFDGEVFVIGGGEIYRLLLPYCTEALLTHVEEEGEADCFFPNIRADFFLQEERVGETGKLRFCRYAREVQGRDKNGDF